MYKYIEGEMLVIEEGEIYHLEYNPQSNGYERVEMSVEDLVNQYKALDKKHIADGEYYRAIAKMWENKYTEYKEGIETALKLVRSKYE